jgi:aspartyl-tRNA(Asn)/glutamyl-tRNA(Gln) amidotransferase subunit B
VLAEMVATGASPAEIAATHGFEAMDTSALEAVVDQAIADNAGAWEKVVAGDGKALGAIVGAVMKATQGKADGKAVNQLLQQKKAAG